MAVKGRGYLVEMNKFIFLVIVVIIGLVCVSYIVVNSPGATRSCSQGK